jgi:CDP-diglyceride synthetase
MGCLLALLAGFAPRVALVLVWIFSNLVDRAFTGLLIPLLGLIFFPYATLFYVLAYNPVTGVNGLGWALVILGFIFDMGHWAGGGRTGRQRYATA